MILRFTLSVAFLALIGNLPASKVNAEETPAAPDTTTVREPALREEILAMVKLDQEIRKKALASRSAEVLEEMRGLDAKHEDRIRKIIGKVGWPGRTLVGDDGSSGCWMLVQHCTPRFQERCLPLLEQAVRSGEAKAKNYAYLVDRVRMHQGKPQVYGTQFRNNKLWAIEDPERVDARRASVGLGPLAEYERETKAALERGSGSRK